MGIEEMMVVKIDIALLHMRLLLRVEMGVFIINYYK